MTVKEIVLDLISKRAFELHPINVWINDLNEIVCEKNSEVIEADIYNAADMYYNFDESWCKFAFDILPNEIQLKVLDEDTDVENWFKENKTEIDKSINKVWEKYLNDSVDTIIENYENREDFEEDE